MSAFPSIPPAVLSIDVRRHPVVSAVGARLRELVPQPPDPWPVVVAVSGGADSTALLIAAAALAGRARGPRLIPSVVHVHHHLRPEATAEAEGVARLAERFGLACAIEHVRPDAAAGGLGDACRRTRREALDAAAVRLGAPHVLAGHHAGDQLETLLMALARGAGSAGLRGMPASRALGSVTLLRPALDLEPEALRDLCRTAGVAWFEDPSNAAGPRGDLRAEVLPRLEARWPGARRHAAAAAEQVAAAHDALEHLVRAHFGPPDRREWPRDTLRALTVPVIAAGLRRAALAVQPERTDDLGAVRMRAAAVAVCGIDTHPRRFDWGANLELIVEARSVRLVEHT